MIGEFDIFGCQLVNVWGLNDFLFKGFNIVNVQIVGYDVNDVWLLLVSLFSLFIRFWAVVLKFDEQQR